MTTNKHYARGVRAMKHSLGLAGDYERCTLALRQALGTDKMKDFVPWADRIVDEAQAAYKREARRNRA
jgi:hypothetical protein